MTATETTSRLVEIDMGQPIWERFYTVAPLILVGTKDEDGKLDLAPKHMATPLGWQNYFGFVCTPAHATCRNVEKSGVFTVSFPKPSQVLFSSLAASPRLADGNKPVLDYFRTFPARIIDGSFVDDAYLFLECRHFKTIDGFGPHCLITGEIVAAHADPAFLRSSEIDDQELIQDSPLLAYLAPGRFASVARSNAFPFPANMRK